VPQTGKWISVASGQTFSTLCGHLEDILLLNNFFPIIDMCLSCEDIARQSCAMVPRWQFLATLLRPVFSASRVKHVSDLHLNGPVVPPKNFKRLCMGDKVPPYSASNILDNWSRIVCRITRSCTPIQAESNKLFFVIIKCVFVEIFRKFQRHCFYSFPRDFCL